MKVVVTDLRLHSDGNARCGWCGDDEDYVAYHDAEWGVGATSDNEWYEKVCLEGFQSGLSWITILRRRARFGRCLQTSTQTSLRRLLTLMSNVLFSTSASSATEEKFLQRSTMRNEPSNCVPSSAVSTHSSRTMSSLISTSHMRSSMCQHKPIRHAPSQKNCGAGVDICGPDNDVCDGAVNGARQ